MVGRILLLLWPLSLCSCVDVVTATGPVAPASSTKVACQAPDSDGCARGMAAHVGAYGIAQRLHGVEITDLARERVIEGRTYTKTTAEEDDILRQRLNDVVAKIQFATLPAADAKK